MGYFLAYFRICVLFFFILYLPINCDVTIHAHNNNNSSYVHEENVEAKKYTPELPLSYVNEKPIITEQPNEKDKLSKTSSNDSIEDAMQLPGQKTPSYSKLQEEIPLPIIWYKQWTPNDVYSTMIKSPSDSNELITFSAEPYSVNPVSAINRLPAVYPTYVSGIAPYYNQLNQLSYGMDAYDPTDLFMSHVRPVGSRDEDLLAQLSHDADIQNILPTMPFPYFREAVYPSVYETHAHVLPLMARYSTSKSSNCAIPLHLICSPQITQGTLEDDIVRYMFNPDPVVPETYYTTEQMDIRPDEIKDSSRLVLFKGTPDVNADKYA